MAVAIAMDLFILLMCGSKKQRAFLGNGIGHKFFASSNSHAS